MRDDPVVQDVAAQHGTDRLRWGWIAIGVLLGGGMIGSVLLVVDPRLVRPAVAGFHVTLAILLVGMLVGYGSSGETILEAGVTGVILVLGTGICATVGLAVSVPGFVWLLSLFLVPAVAMLGGWAGELLQGTLEEAYDDRAVDWPWVIASIIVGFTLSSYAVLLGQSLFGLTNRESLAVFAGSFLLTGWIIGFFSPGMTMIEPAIAGALMMVVDTGFVIMVFGDLPGAQVVAFGFFGAILFALLGGWLGEFTQKWTRGRGGPPRS